MKVFLSKHSLSRELQAFSKNKSLPGIENVLRLILLFTLGFQPLIAQPKPPVVIKGVFELRTLASLPKILKEASGVEISASGLIWSHNDDRLPILYGIDTLGNVTKAIHLNHKNNGWEDLCLDKHGNLYIGAFGNNNNDRRDLSILKLPDPESLSGNIINAEIIGYKYSDQVLFPPPRATMNFDADAFVNIDDSLYIITKNRTAPSTGFAKVYRLPTTPGKYEAVPVDSLYLGGEAEFSPANSSMANWVTSADISPDGKWLALLSHDCIWLVTDFQQNRFSTGKVFRINLGNFSHKAGLCFKSNNHIYVVDELELGFLGGKLYSLDLRPILKAILEAKSGTP